MTFTIYSTGTPKRTWSAKALQRVSAATCISRHWAMFISHIIFGCLVTTVLREFWEGSANSIPVFIFLIFCSCLVLAEKNTCSRCLLFERSKNMFHQYKFPWPSPSRPFGVSSQILEERESNVVFQISLDQSITSDDLRFGGFGGRLNYSYVRLNLYHTDLTIFHLFLAGWQGNWWPPISMICRMCWWCLKITETFKIHRKMVGSSALTTCFCLQPGADQARE